MNTSHMDIVKHQLFSGASLLLQKEGWDIPAVTHTSCRSKSSYICLVVFRQLDEEQGTHFNIKSKVNSLVKANFRKKN